MCVLEYIVGFEGYYTKEARRKFITAALNSGQISKVRIMKHSDLVENYPSDFDVVLVGSTSTII
jgi:hypothetical protein